MKSAVLETKSKSSSPRYERLEARVSPYLKELFQEAADLRGVTLSDFIISSAHDVAVQTMDQHKFIRLSREASIQFAKALSRPPRPNAKLRAAAERYMKRSNSTAKA